MKRKMILTLTLALSLGIAGCGSPIDGEKALDTQGTYTTQTRYSAAEYSIYIEKQVTAFCTQLLSLKGLCTGSSDFSYENAGDSVTQAIATMQDIRDEVNVIYPPQGAEDDRKSILEDMDTGISHAKELLDEVDSKGDITAFSQYFNQDFNALTGLVSTYNQ